MSTLNTLNTTMLTLPAKQSVPLDAPLAFFPLTASNMRDNLPRVLQQFFQYDLQHQQRYEAIARALYTPNAQFHYPAALLTGRDSIIQFWNSFLIGRAFMLNDVHSLRIGLTWDPVQLQAFLQLEAWQHIKPFAFLDALTGIPSWKVSSTHIIQFVEFPADGPGALRIAHHEELADQFVFLGLIPTGLNSIRTDPGTPLDWVRSTVQRAVGQAIAVGTPLLVRLLQGVGWIRPMHTE